MSEAQTPPSVKKTVVWPVTINLLLLLVAVVIGNIDFGALVGFFLALLNGLIGFIFLLFERRRDAGYAGGFFLSFLLLLMIGFGLCSRSTGGRSVPVEVMPAPSTRLKE